MKRKIKPLLTFVHPLLCSLLISEAVFARELWHIFCDGCTNRENNAYLNEAPYHPLENRTKDQKKLLDIVQEFEDGLDPDKPDESQIAPEIIGHGATSIGFRIPGFENYLVRRLPGFTDFESAKQHLILINQYRSKLHHLSIQTTKSQLIALEDSNGYGVVYVIQPFLKGDQLSKSTFKKYGEPFKKKLLNKQAEIARIVISHNRNNPASAITVDIVNNNWEIADLNPETMAFDIRLNDIAQPLFKENYKLTYDFHDQAFSIISPLSWLFIQPEMIKEFGEIFEPRNLMMQALWGYDEVKPKGLWQGIYSWVVRAPEIRAYPDWAMEIANDVLQSYNFAEITSDEALTAHQQDKHALACLDIYRELSHRLRQSFRLSSNVYMTPDKKTKEMYFNEHPPGYGSCFVGALQDAFSELFYGPPD